MYARASNEVRALWLLVVIVQWGFVAPSAAGGAQDETLRGLGSVAVVVEVLSENARAAGFDRDVLRTDVELKLRLAGIVVGESASSSDSWLYVNVTALHNQGNFGQHGPFFVALELNQDATLKRNGVLVVGATTWNDGFLGNGDFDYARVKLKMLVDGFLNAWLKQNPRQDRDRTSESRDP